jgi:hypothetical protein
MAAPIDDDGFGAGQRGGAEICADETYARKKIAMWWDPRVVFAVFSGGVRPAEGHVGVSMECYPESPLDVAASFLV